MAKKKNVIITGAAGLVGTILRQHWGDRYALRLADIRPVENLQAHEEFAQLNITDLDSPRRKPSTGPNCRMARGPFLPMTYSLTLRSR